MTMDKRDWPKQTWKHPLVHNFNFGFGLDMNETAATKYATIAPYCFQDNAIIDYETIKTNKENADFAVVAKPNCAAGSYVPKVMVQWEAWSPSSEVDVMKFNTMKIHTSFLNRLDAFDKKTGTDIEAILELTHEVTDEQCYPLWDTTKLYEGHVVTDYPAEVPGLTGTQQPEGVAFDQNLYFNALHYYTNRSMLRKVTDRFKTHYLNGFLEDDINFNRKIVRSYSNHQNSIAKYMNPYTFVGELFNLPQASFRNQYQNASSTTAIEHLTVQGRVRFMEYNPDFNFARA